MPTGPADGIHLHGNLVDRRGQGYENDLHSIGPRDAEATPPPAYSPFPPAQPSQAAPLPAPSVQFTTFHDHLRVLGASEQVVDLYRAVHRSAEQCFAILLQRHARALNDVSNLQNANAKLQEEVTRLTGRQQELMDRVEEYQRERFQVWVAANGAAAAEAPQLLVTRPVGASTFLEQRARPVKPLPANRPRTSGSRSPSSSGADSASTDRDASLRVHPSTYQPARSL